MKEENSELRELLKIEKSKNEELELENGSLKVDIQIYEARDKSFTPILKANQELRDNLEIYESKVEDGNIE